MDDDPLESRSRKDGRKKDGRVSRIKGNGANRTRDTTCIPWRASESIMTWNDYPDTFPEA